MMGGQSMEHASSTLRICCNLIAKHGKLCIVDRLAMTDIRDGCMRKAITRGVELGYLVEGPKVLGTRRNRRKTWMRTKKKFPPEIEKIEAAPEPVVWGEPFRHWQDEALFGAAPRMWSSSAKAEVRVFRQSMSVADDEMEAV